MTEPKDFVTGGTPEEQLMGMCETTWEPNMGPDQLFECISQVFDKSLMYFLTNLCASQLAREGKDNLWWL